MDVDLELSADELARLVASPAALDDLAGTTGGLVVVTGEGSGPPLVVPPRLGAVVIEVASEPDAASSDDGRRASGDGRRASGADVVVGRDELEVVRAAVGRHPQAATALALLLRGAGERSVAEGLAVESAVYGVLQAGPEFAAWRAATPARPLPAPERDPVIVSRHGSVLHVVLDHHEVRNALDAPLRDALAAALAIALEDPTLQVELHGDGPCFCSGGHLDEFGTRTDPASAHLLRTSRSLGAMLHDLRDRTQVFVQGPCRGSGVELPAFAGQVIAAADATFALPEVSMGLIPGAGGTVSLPRRIGRARTAWLALIGQPIDAPTALAWGLVDLVTPT